MKTLLNRWARLPLLVGGVWLLAAVGLVAAEARHPLWVVEGKQAKVYLLGSIHLLNEQSLPFPKVFEEAFQDAEVVTFESDLAAMNQPDSMMRFMAKGMLPPNETLADRLPDELYQDVRRRAEAVGLPPGSMDRQRPWMCALTLTVSELTRNGFSSQAGVDMHYFRQARMRGKQLDHFEDLEHHLSLFGSMKPEEEVALLKQTLRDLDLVLGQLDKLVAAWRSGDAAALNQIQKQSFQEYPGVEKLLVTDRNQKWLPRVEKYLQGEQDVLVIVGTLHLIGEQGLVRLLEKQGHPVTQK